MSTDVDQASIFGPSEPAATGAATAAQTDGLQPTPACLDDDDIVTTPARSEGPYYTPHSPERASLLEPGMEGTEIILMGCVQARDQRPLAGVLLDFWQADANGEYDKAGYGLRGHQFTNKQGWYYLETIVPGIYPERVRHIHVKIQAPDRPILTTQLYFPDEPDNAADPFFRPELLLTIHDTPVGKVALFDFVLDMS